MPDTSAQHRAEQDRLIEIVRDYLSALEPSRTGSRTVTRELCKAGRASFPGSDKVKLFASSISKPIADDGEWLFDVTCLLYDEVGFIQRVPFVAECEWRRKDDVYDDFEKLLLARADVRIMVFKADPWDSTETAFAELQAYIAAFQPTSPHDAYLFAAWTRGVGFKFHSYYEGVTDIDWLT